MRDTSAAHWRMWGDQDPYFAVLSDPKYRRGSLAAHRAEFFATGRAEIAHRMDILERLYGEVPSGTAVDFGCGVGRLVVPLADRYRHVIGIDVSPAMIAEAQRNCAAHGVANVSFSASPLDLPDRVDLVHSSLVLQHIPTAHGMTLIGQLLDRLGPGGIAALQMPLARRLGWRREAVYRAGHVIPGARLALNVLRGRRWNEPLMQMNPYDLSAAVTAFAGRGLQEIFVEPDPAGGSGVVIHGRRPA